MHPARPAPPAARPASPRPAPLAAAVRWLLTGDAAVRPESRHARRERAYDEYARAGRRPCGREG